MVPALSLSNTADRVTQWGQREPEEQCDLFGEPVLIEGEQQAGPIERNLFMARQNELQTARTSRPAENKEPSSTSSVRCIEGSIVCPSQHEQEPPSTACNSSTVSINTQEEFD